MIPFRSKPHWLILGALLLAVPAGLMTNPESAFGFVRPYAVYDFLGRLFLRALMMLVVPLIVAAMINAVASAGTGLGKMGGKSLLFYLVSGVLAVLGGLFFVNLFRPGIVDGQPARNLIGLGEASPELLGRVADRSGADLWMIFQRMIPDNVVSAAANAEMLALITFSILYGLLIPRLPARLAEPQLDFWRGVYEVMLGMTRWVMIFAPIGVFALVARSLTVAGLSAFAPLLGFFFTVLAALLVHMFVTLPGLLFFWGRVNPWRHFRAMGEALLMAFTTSSSNATLPKTLECLETKAGVPRRVSGFVAPLGATINMDGTALYECVAALFIAQCYGLEMTLGVQFTVVTLALVSSVGVAGIPSASLVAIAVILTAIGLPIEGLGLILAVDRILDMCRTAVNVYSDTCAAAVVGRGMGS
jgi:Na+/H+-dicarboxylate symporter